MTADPIAVVEAAYSLTGDEEVWLRRVASTLAPIVDEPLGVAAFTLHLDQAGAVAIDSFGASAHEKTHRLVAQAINDAIPPDAAREFYAPGTYCSTASQSDELPASELYQQFGAPHGIHDFIGLRTIDADGSAIVIGAPLSEVGAMSPADRRMWRRLASHFRAALRLRRRFANSSLDSAAAILDPDGRIAHLDAQAEDAGALSALRAYARQIDQARSRMRHAEPQEALDLWTALTSGRWSLVDHFDSDGRRFLVARRNEAEVADPRALSERERQVVHYVACGFSQKEIAYELGISSSTVGTVLSRSLRKLGLKSRAELVRLMRALWRESQDRDRDASKSEPA